MRRLSKILSQQNKAVLTFVLVIGLLVQGVIGASGACMMAMDSSSADQTQTMSHDGHDMGEMTEVTDHEHQESTYGHICPPDGCYICASENCSQCSPSQMFDMAPQEPIFLYVVQSEALEFPRLVSFIVSKRHWSIPPARAPPASSFA